MSLLFKLSTCSAIIGGIVGIPLKYGIFAERKLIQVPGFSAVPKTKKVLTLGSSKKDNSLALSIKNMDKLLAKVNQKVSFQEIGLKFGNTVLNGEDKLASPCQDGKYYLAKYRGGKWGLDYELGNKKIVNTFNCLRMQDYEGLDFVNIDWARPKESGGEIYLSSITVGSCVFARRDERKVEVLCREYWDKKRGSSGSWVWGMLTLEEKEMFS